MSTHERTQSFLRVLAAVAWADGELSSEEESYLRGLFVECGLNAEEVLDLLPLLESPVSREEFERYAREFEEHFDSQEDRTQLLESVEQLIGVDRVRAPEERAYLRHLRDWLTEVRAEEASPPLWTRLLGMVGLARQEPALASTPWAPRIATSVAERLVPGSAAQGISGPRWTYVTLFGALLQRAIDADGVVRPEEQAALRRILGAVSLFNEMEIDYMLQLVRDRAAEGAERQRLCAEFNRISTMDDRLHLLEALFAVARADGELSAAEQDELRLLSNYLWIEAQEFVRIRRESGDRPARS